MAAKTEAEKALDEREKLIAEREKAVAEREDALPAAAEPEDLTPTPTQAENDAAVRAMGRGAVEYKTRDAKAE